MIRRRLGAGGMGVVYEALDRQRDALVALKTLRNANPRAIARFKREFRSLADVIHPNLVALYELIADGEQAFFTMELVEGAHFGRWVRHVPDTDDTAEDQVGRDSDAGPTRSLGPGEHTCPTSVSRPPVPTRETGKLDVTRLRLGLRQLAEGVAAIHDAGLLHRDLKPSNVLVTDSGRVVILDFGLVADIADESFASVEHRPLEGTATYMSPEQGARHPLTPASDWYSVGVILYLVLTGRPPFLGGREDVLMDKQRFEPPPPHEIVPEAPQDLSALCTELLRRSPERRPTGRDVLRRLGSERIAGAARTTSISSQSAYDVVVGRDDELAELDRAYAATRAGASVLVHIDGPSGMGKSRLVRAFLDGLAGGEPVVVLRGRCYERESVPFKAVDSIVDALTQHLIRLAPIDVEGLMPRDALALARVFPVMRQIGAITAQRRRDVVTPDPQELRRKAFGAMRELLERLADRQPVVIAIDDLQWGDVDSAALLATLLRPPDQPSLLLIACYRSEERDESPFLQAFERQMAGAQIDARQIEVGPLSREDARQLALLHIGTSGDALAHAARIADESQGSPFFVEELARHVADAEGEPVSLDDVLRNRLLRLPTPAGRVLSAIAVAGRPIDQTVAFRAAQESDPAALSLLKAGGFVRTRSVRGSRFVEPYHDRVRDAAVALLSEEELRAQHLALAKAIEALPHPDPEPLALHYRGAGEDALAAEFAAAAARRAAEALAFDRAAYLYWLAIELAGPPADRGVLVELGDALANAGRGADAADAYLAAVDGAATTEALDLRCRASARLLASGHLDRGLSVLEDVLAAVGMRLASTPGRALASLVWSRARIALRGLRYHEKEEREVPASQLTKVDVTFAVAEGLGMADVIRAADFQARSFLLALKAGEPRRVARALAGEAVFSSLRGVDAAERTRRVQAKLEEIAARLDEPEVRGLALGAAGMCAFNEGRWSDCNDNCRKAESIFRDECVGHRWELATTQLFQGFALALMGRVSEMIRRFPLLLKDANERGDLYAATSLRACLGFYIPLTNDDPESALREVDDAMARWSPIGFHLQHANALNSRVSIDLYSREGTRAVERCETAWRDLERSLLLRTQLLRGLLWSLRGRAALSAIAQRGDTSLLALARKCNRKLERENVAYCACQARLLRAGIAFHQGELDVAAHLLAEAEQLSVEAGLALSAATMRRARGILAGADGDSLVAESDEFMLGQGLRNPAAVMEVFAPGFYRATGRLLR